MIAETFLLVIMIGFVVPSKSFRRRDRKRRNHKPVISHTLENMLRNDVSGLKPRTLYKPSLEYPGLPSYTWDMKVSY
jgi:hypothetical protein